MGLYRIAGVSLPLTIGGITYQTSSQITFGMRAEIEAHIVSKRPNFMEQVANGLERLPAKYHKDAIAEAVKRMAMANSVTNEEFEDYLNTFEGSSYLLWLLIREKQPNVDSLDKAKDIAAKIELSQLQAMLDRAAGLSALKNSNGPASAAATGPAAQTTENVERIDATITSGNATSENTNETTSGNG